MTTPANLKYAASHEWAKLEADGTVSIGITDHAQEALGDIVFLELPAVGRIIKAGEEYIHGHFRENVITRQNVAQIPKDYRFYLKKTVRQNYATNRATVEYAMVDLKPLSGRKPSSD